MSDTRKSNTQTAVDALRELIFTGALPPGSNHLETDLATQLGMSRTPIHEAALLLEAQGLLKIQPRRGLHILGLSVDDMREIYDILTELESLAAARAAQAGHSEAALRRLSESITLMERAVQREDRQAWAMADEVFHRELVRLSGNRHLEEMVSRVLDQVRRARNLTLHLRPLPAASTADHRKLVEAIGRGDAESARRCHCAHRTRARDVMTELLGRIGKHQV